MNHSSSSGTKKWKEKKIKIFFNKENQRDERD